MSIQLAFVYYSIATLGTEWEYTNVNLWLEFYYALLYFSFLFQIKMVWHYYVVKATAEAPIMSL